MKSTCTNWYNIILEISNGANGNPKFFVYWSKLCGPTPKRREVSIVGGESHTNISATTCPLLYCVLIRGGVATASFIAPGRR